jgi:hypothetical protein
MLAALSQGTCALEGNLSFRAQRSAVEKSLDSYVADQQLAARDVSTSLDTTTKHRLIRLLVARRINA